MECKPSVSVLKDGKRSAARIARPRTNKQASAAIEIVAFFSHNACVLDVDRVSNPKIRRVIQKCRKSGQVEKYAGWEKGHADLLPHVLLEQMRGCVYLNCCSTLRTFCEHSMHLKVAR